MIAIAITVASLLTTQVSPIALRESTVGNTAVTAASEIPNSADHIATARRALTNAEFDVARREFVIAAALDRDDGKLPIDAVFGLANVLYLSSFSREAAIVLDKFATEAAAVGDYNTEARALMDAIWLNVDAGQRTQARNDGIRLRELLKGGVLSAETLRTVKARFR